MGVNCGNLVLLAEYAKRRPLGNVLTLGRLFSTLTASDRRKLARHQEVPEELLRDGCTEALFRHLGAASVTSLDISPGEGCDWVADLTEDLADDPANAARMASFDTILDFGTNEHVFDVPQSLANAWNLLRPGGVYVYDLPVSGWLSHCLYQFTPGFFVSLAATPYFDEDHAFFHRKHGDRIYRVLRYTRASYARLNGRARISAWGVLAKRTPEGHDGPLRPRHLKVPQVDPRAQAAQRPRGVLGRLRGYERYSAATAGRVFA